MLSTLKVLGIYFFMNKKYKIVITGAESTGKSTLSEKLAKHYNTLWLPEFAREYVENLNRNYTYLDVERIAKKQIELEAEYIKRANKILFVDTSLIITKIWFEVLYNKVPEWFEDKYKNHKPDFYLLCSNDIEWKADKVRENGGEMRQKLFKRYENEIIKSNVPYSIITGKDKERIKNAINSINKRLIIKPKTT